MKKEGQNVRKGLKRKKTIALIITIVIMVIFMLTGLILVRQLNIRFGFNTVINGVDCSLLTVEEATEKLNNMLSTKMISFNVLYKNEKGDYIDKTYGSNSKLLELKLETSVEEILKVQKESKTKDFNIQYVVNEDALREYLLSLDELQEENMIEPQNAYLQMSNGKVEIVSEIYGLEIDFNEAYNLALSRITSGETSVDFTGLFKTDPEILSTDESLVENQTKINTILNTSITFVLNDNTEEVLDRNVISNWIYQDSDGLFYLDETNIEKYINSLAEIVDEKNSQISFNATGIGEISLYLNDSLKPNLDIDAEFTFVKEALYSGEICRVEPIYDKDFVNNSQSYVELDISRQKVWLYIGEECILETDCVTGNVSGGYSTPTGIYYLTYKTRGATLRGYNSDGSRYASYVEYWMPFNGGIGFHDASWRSSFGGNIYLTNGSHGCVNMPRNAAKILYDYIDSSMPIFVYAS